MPDSRSFLARNGLTLALLALFGLSLLGQVLTGRAEHNGERAEKGAPPLDLSEYLVSGHFVEAVGENWESEFLQMLAFIMLTVFLYQRGSPESKDSETNVFAYFYLVRAALKHFRKGSVIINTASVTAYRGSEHLVDYAASKGAEVSLTRSLSSALVERGIRVNAVAPGPVWTPLIPASFRARDVAMFGSDVPMGRAGEPAEIAPCFVFLASNDSSYMTGQVLHPNGGEIVNG